MTIPQSAVARAVGVTTTFKDLSGGKAKYVPQHIAVFAQGASAVTYPTSKYQATSAGEVAERYGYGSPLHLIARELHVPGSSIPVTYFPLVDGGSAAPAVGTVTPSGTQAKAAEYRLRIGGVESEAFVVPKGAVTVGTLLTAMAAAVNGVLHMPVIATENGTTMTLTTKWAGVSANGVKVEVIGDTTQGTTFALVQPTGGLVDPTVDTALTLTGSTWYTVMINALDPHNATAMDTFQAHGELQWATNVHQPLKVVRGNNDATMSAATAETATRTDDRVNVQITVEGSTSLPCVIAAAAVRRIAAMANTDPAHDYARQVLDSIIPGPDDVQWDYTTRDAALKAGTSTTKVVDGTVQLSDTITSWSPASEPDPAYRFVCDIVKLQQLCWNMSLTFNNPDWDGAPLVTDDDVTSNPSAKKPRMAKAAANAVLDGLGDAAILTNVAAAKKVTTAVIAGPKRLDVGVTVQLSGNANQIDIQQGFGFYYGG